MLCPIYVSWLGLDSRLQAKTGIDFRKTSADDFVLRCQRALGINVDALNKQGNRMAILRFYLQDHPKGKWVKFEIGTLTSTLSPPRPPTALASANAAITVPQRAISIALLDPPC